MQFTGERVVPWAKDMQGWSWVMRDHLARYLWAIDWVSGKNVVDIGCGTGYGTFMLSWLASSAVGVDINPESIQFARDNFSHPSVSFSEVDLSTDSLPWAEVYVAFEVLEHLDDPRRVIEIVGNKTLLWSVPVNDPGRFHKRVYDARSAALLVPGSVIWHQYRDGHIGPPSVTQPKYILGVANA